MTYHNNAKAWMITSLFQEWIQEFDHQVGLKHQGQRVLLFLDNCSSHKLDGLTLRYTDVHFLPSNTTSKIQPIDAGVIMSFKRHYRHSHVRLLLRYVEAGNRAEDLRMDILQTIRFIIQAWGEINPEVVRNCWWHTKILPDDVNVNLRNVSEDIRQNENLVLDELADALRDLNLSYLMQAEEFLYLPEENIVYKVPEDNKIIEELVYLFKNTDKENMDLEEIDNSDEIPIISTSTAIASLETVQKESKKSDEWLSSLQYLNANINNLTISELFLDPGSEFSDINDSAIKALKWKADKSFNFAIKDNFKYIITDVYKRISYLEENIQKVQGQIKTNSILFQYIARFQ
ncbi:tigger transposable element-derived protein 6-like [Rhizophagus irregularis DAOM 181602=DAOM 197198]|nr:tigger transposable element-derived protein 6-like [Rhizophagus irregularis DAOM 181602=DAOM 197198]